MAQTNFNEGVPDTSAQVQAPDDYQRINATPAQFGGLIAQGEQQLGAGATQASKFYGQVAANDGNVGYMNAVNKILHGDPNVEGDTGYMGLTGADALKQRPIVEQQIEQLRQQTRENMPTLESQLNFDEYSRHFQSITSGQVGEQADRQMKVYNEGVQDSRIVAAQNNAANAATTGNGDLAIQSREDLRSAITQKNQNKYGNDLPPEILHGGIDQADRMWAVAQIGGVADKNPVMAQKIYDQNSEKFAGTKEESEANNLLNNGWKTAIQNMALANPQSANDFFQAHKSNMSPEVQAQIGSLLKPQMNAQIMDNGINAILGDGIANHAQEVASGVTPANIQIRQGEVPIPDAVSKQFSGDNATAISSAAQTAVKNLPGATQNPSQATITPPSPTIPTNALPQPTPSDAPIRRATSLVNNLPTLVNQARQFAVSNGLDPNMAENNIRSKVERALGDQRNQDSSDYMTVSQYVNGIGNNAVKITDIAQLNNAPIGVRDAWLNVQRYQPDVARSMVPKWIKENNSGPGGEGPLRQVRQLIDAGTIASPQQLAAYVGQNGLTTAQQDNALSYMGRDPQLKIMSAASEKAVIEKLKGPYQSMKPAGLDSQIASAQIAMDKAFVEGRNNGIPASELYDPKNKNWVGNVINPIVNSPQTLTTVPSVTPPLHALADIDVAVSHGTMTGQESKNQAGAILGPLLRDPDPQVASWARTQAINRGLMRPNPQALPQVPVSSANGQ